MAQLLLGAAGSAIGGALLPSGLNVLGAHLTGGAIGGFIGSTLGAHIDQALLGQDSQHGPRLTEMPVQTSADGAPIPLLFGRARIAGQVIWAARLTERAEKSSVGGKGGGPTRVDYQYSISFAVGLCEGEISGIGRIWANGALMDLTGINYRLHRGTDGQAADALIETIEGADNTPAFRGLAYVVFEDLPLDAYGARIPNLSFEVFRPAQSSSDETRLEDLVRGVDLIPASGEFSYETQTIVRDISPGRDQAENVNNGRGLPDLIAALDDLENQLPNCRSILLVSAWFGDDLRCGECQIRPGVESRDKVTRPVSWAVAGQDRTTAWLVTQMDGQPVFGGTPSDASLVAAMQEIRARGFSVSLYPFILMDIASGNALPDPWGTAEQAAFPWRGRITCHPAPGQPESADQTLAADTQVTNFFGAASAGDFEISNGVVHYSGPEEWSFRRFILHHAALAKAGGASGFLIGSEMRGLTQIRGASGFAAVDQLCDLADSARAILGSGVRLSYAADWSEYFGFQPGDGSGDLFFHLDPLWSHDAIDAVAIDWYVPLSDWREGTSHLDSELSDSIHDRAFLASQMEGGEGYDWYYASAEDRDFQIRTPITDGAYGKPWVYRYKDIRNWWGNFHHDRIGGVEQSAATNWRPESKPIWITETGCPAVDAGSNQPNVFVDPKSAESQLPYASRGAGDDLIQRRYVEAVISYWDTAAGHNPVSSDYGGPMVDTDSIHVWTWDARPFPDFPARQEVWADGANWRLGHWISGRASLAPLQGVVEDLCRRVDLVADFSNLDGVVSGFLLDRPVTARAALETLSLAHGFDLADGAEGPRFFGRDAASAWSVGLDEAVISDSAGAVTRTSAPSGSQLQDVRIRFIEDQGDYAPGSVQARGPAADPGRVLDLSWPLLSDGINARAWALDILNDAAASAQALEFSLPPSRMAVEAGDVIRLGPDVTVDAYRVASATGLGVRALHAEGRAGRCASLAGPTPRDGPHLPWSSTPEVVVIDMPLLIDDDAGRDGPLIAAYCDRWSGRLRVLAGTDASDMTERTYIDTRANIGVVQNELAIAAPGRWHETASLIISWASSDIASVDRLAVLNGANQLAIQTLSGEWRTVQFATATMVSPGTFRIESLLHDDVCGEFRIETGARAVMLSPRLQVLPVSQRERSVSLNYSVCDVGAPLASVHCASGCFLYEGRDLEPLAPVHIKAVRHVYGIQISWLRRTRVGGDDWAPPDVPLGETDERYRVDILAGGEQVATRETTASSLLLTADEEVGIFGGPATEFTVQISQISERFGAGRVATAALHL